MPFSGCSEDSAVDQGIERRRPIAHLAVEFHIARATLSKLVGRYRAGGVARLKDRSIASANRPSLLSTGVFEHRQLTRKLSARWIACEIAEGSQLFASKGEVRKAG